MSQNRRSVYEYNEPCNIEDNLTRTCFSINVLRRRYTTMTCHRDVIYGQKPTKVGVVGILLVLGIVPKLSI